MNRKLTLLFPVLLALILLAVVLVLPAAAQDGQPPYVETPVEEPEGGDMVQTIPQWAALDRARVAVEYFFWDFEADDGGFVADPIGEWEWGTPTYPPGITPFSGVNVWGTDLDADAADSISNHLLTKTVTLPVAPDGIVLGWWDWFGDEVSDERQVWISDTLVWDDDNGTDQRYWAQQIVDISAWAGQTVDIVFNLDVCCGEPGPDGWYIDDVVIASGWPIYGESSKSATQAVPGQVMTYTVVVANTGAATGTQTYLSDPIPTGTSYVPGSAQVEGGGTLTATSSLIEWMGTLPVGEHVTITFGVTVTASSGLITNTAFITDPAAMAPATPYVVSILPLQGLFEDFENGGEIPQGWTNDTGDAEDWEFGTSASYGADYDHTTGSGYLAWLDDSSPHDTPTNLLSPLVDLTGFSNPLLSFWVWNRSTDGTPVSELHIDIHDGSTWIADIAVISDSLTTWTEFFIDLSPYVSSNARIRFRGVETSDYRSDISLDDVLISDPMPNFTGSWKQAGSTAIDFNDPLTYTIYITNSGGMTSTAGRMFDMLPTGLLVTDGMIDGPGLLDVGTDYVEWTTTPANGLGPGEDVTITIVATSTTALECGATFTNSAVITDAQAIFDIPIQSSPVSVYPAIFFNINFEADDGGFVANPGGEWAWGDLVPSPNAPSYAHSGSRLWATNLSGDIPAEPSDHYLTYTLTLPDDPRGLYLEWWDWWHEDGSDEGYVYVNDITNTLYFINSNQLSWQSHAVDLSAWAGQTVDIVFYYLAGGASDGGAGWYIDDVTLRSGCPTLTFGPDQSTSACQGEEVTYYLTVDNVSDAADVFNITWMGDTWPTVITPTVLALGPGEQGTVTTTVFVPYLTPVGSMDTVTITATGQNSGLVDQAVVQTFYSGVGQAWEMMAPLPEGRVFEAVAATDDYVYVFGGTSDAGGSVPVSTTFRYDIAANTWMTMADMPVALSQVDVGVVGDQIYIPGGQTAEGWDDTTYVYDIAGDTWSTIDGSGTFTGAIQYSVAVSGTTLYRLGGLVDDGSGGFVSSNRVWALDTETEVWSELPFMQQDRISFSAEVIDGNIYVAGGVHYPGFTPEMTTEVYTGTWSYVAPVPDDGGAYTRWSYNADAVANGLLFLMAGRRDASWTVLDHTGYYNPDTDSWVTTPALPVVNQPRVYLGGAAGGGYLFATGGRNSVGDVIYDAHERLRICTGCELPDTTFDYDPVLPLPSQEVVFTATILGGAEPIAFNWAFGDGATGAGTVVTHTYASTGTYTVVLTATNVCGTSVYTDEITIASPTAPTAAFHTDSPVLLGDPMHFFNDSIGTSPLSYMWDFGDGMGTSTAENPTYTYSDYGTFTVTMTVTNPYGVDTVMHTVEVVVAPMCDFTAQPNPAGVNEPVQFTNLTEGTEPISYIWTFGDGASSVAENPTHAYTSVGTYTVELEAFNDWGSSVCTTTVVVEALPPTADFDSTCPDVIGETSYFTNTSTGSRPFTSYLWTFGDGSGPSFDENPSHTYANAGTYTVTLQIANAHGADTVEHRCVIQEVPTAPTCDFTVDPNPAGVNEPVQFTNLTQGTEPISYTWSFGDGEFSVAENPTHTYTSVGTYTVELEAVNDWGSSVCTTTVVIEEACEPVTDVSFTYQPTGIDSGQVVTFTASYSPMTATTPVDINWMFGDGGMASGLEVTHVFTATGSYSVTVTAENCDGAGFASFTQVVDVLDEDFYIYLPIVLKND